MEVPNFRNDREWTNIAMTLQRLGAYHGAPASGAARVMELLTYWSRLRKARALSELM